MTCTTRSSAAASTTGSATRPWSGWPRSSGGGCPAASDALAGHIAGAVGRLRDLDLYKSPGVAEAISWAAALEALGVSTWDTAAAERTLGAVLKYDEDLAAARAAGLTAVLEP